MVKIKFKKQMNLPQLIEWGFKNPKEAESKVFESDNIDYFWNTANVQFSNDGCGVRINSSVSVDDIFTVEVEEEITEDTVLPTLIERRDFGNELTYSRYEYVRIKDIKDRSSTVFYIEKDDLTMTLIWRDGKLVE